VGGGKIINKKPPILSKMLYILSMDKKRKTAGLYFLPIFALLLAFFGCDNPLMKNILQPKIITFESNGGSHVKSQTVLKNEKISEPQTPKKGSHLFEGWFTDNNSFEIRWYFDDIPEGDMTLYANWRLINVNQLLAYLADLTPNTSSNPYYIPLNITDGEFTSLNKTLNEAGKYVILDLSGSNITSIPANAFYNPTSSPASGCAFLTGIIIPDSVVSIGQSAFSNCDNLASVTFKGTIPSSGFSQNSFPGDLQQKYIASDGGPGTYIKEANNTVVSWKKQ
jgi:uncharacterized repeat protein (TIGR02543 family)